MKEAYNGIGVRAMTLNGNLYQWQLRIISRQQRSSEKAVVMCIISVA